MRENNILILFRLLLILTYGVCKLKNKRERKIRIIERKLKKKTNKQKNELERELRGLAKGSFDFNGQFLK